MLQAPLGTIEVTRPLWAIEVTWPFMASRNARTKETAVATSDEQRRVAVIGLGIMGSAMAGNLIKAGFPTTVWNRSASAVRPWWMPAL